MNESSQINVLEKAMKLGHILTTYLIFIWQNQDEDGSPNKMISENYRSVTDLLKSLGISVNIPNPVDKDRINDFLKSLDAANLTQEIQGRLNILYSTHVGTAFFLAATSTMYAIQSELRSEADLFPIRNDIQKMAADIGIRPFLVAEFLKKPGDDSTRLKFYEDIKNTLVIEDGVRTILFLAADPTNVSRLRLGEEFREIQEKLKLAKLGAQFKLELPQLAIRPTDIIQALLDGQAQIVHFSGHGTSAGALCFEDKLGQTQLVQPDALAALFEQFSHQVNCVLLNACHSKIQAKAIGKHIKYVIGMNKAIGDKAAIAFAIGFYSALGGGRTIESAYKLGCVQIQLLNIPEHLTPTLYENGELKYPAA